MLGRQAFAGNILTAFGIQRDKRIPFPKPTNAFGLRKPTKILALNTFCGDDLVEVFCLSLLKEAFIRVKFEQNSKELCYRCWAKLSSFKSTKMPFGRNIQRWPITC